ncbi:17430_t:CDS:1 [Funneliformis geosporum]|nr:17430_t:CDS:1 [Funneliformis geosporum]
MSDSDSMFSDDSDNEIFSEEFLNNLPEDSDKDCFFEASDSSTSTLILEEGQSFLTWKSAFSHIKQWSHQQGFFIQTGRSEKLQNECRKQTILCKYEGSYTNKSKKNKSKPSKTCKTNCKWHVNLSQPVKNNTNKLIYITTLLNEHFRHTLDPSICFFMMNKTFTKPMLDDIE